MKNMLNKPVFLALLLNMGIATISYGQPTQYTIALFAPREDTFWPVLESFMKAACHDLAMECEVYYADDNQIKMRRQIERAGQGPDKVDAVLFQNFKQHGPKFIKTAEELKVNAFLINTPLTPDAYETVGKPREHYRYWIGEMVPDDEGAGYTMAQILIDTAKKKGKVGADGKVRMVGINGIVSDGATIERAKGLNRAIEERSDVKLYQLVPGDWSVEDAKAKFLHLMARYPDTTVVWAGNDAKGFGILQGAKELELSPGEDIFTAGLDWSEEGIQAVRKGEFEVDMGGHFMEAAWVVIMLYDYFHGIDFMREGVQLKSPMLPITSENVERYLELFGNRDWEKIDFTKFSKYLNPELQEYNFGMKAIIDQF